MSVLTSLWALPLGIVWTNAAVVEAKLPLSSHNPAARLRSADDITFDPLAVAAILHNPRADTSAAKLYVQYDRGIFNWPHTMMIGGTLTPVKMLVEHLTASIASIHPAIAMCTKDTINLPVRSDMVFKELPLNLSNIWLTDILAFKPSQRPGNDFMIVYIENLHARVGPSSSPPSSGSWLGRLTLNLIGLLTGMILLVGMVFGVLAADVWAVTLFFLYASHWLASTLISMTSLVQIHEPQNSIVEDASIRYAVYQRPEGGTVVFKGRQDTLERWARTTWEFRRSLKNNCLHWFWITSGTLAAIASVACMVNMRGYMQLAFLAALVYSSLAEILATRISRNLQVSARGPRGKSLVQDNPTRTQGIIRATVEIDPMCRLEGLDWVQLGLLPSRDIFQRMQVLLARINAAQNRETGSGLDPASEMEKAIDDFLKGTDVRDQALASRIASETRQALNAWYRVLESVSKQKVEAQPVPV